METTAPSATHHAPPPPPAPSPVPQQSECASSCSTGGPLRITAAAARLARYKLACRETPSSAIRVGIKGGGCAGYKYQIAFEDGDPSDRDEVLETAGVRFVVDRKSALILAGTILDAEESLMETGFKFRNPRETRKCGCGQSFATS